MVYHHIYCKRIQFTTSDVSQGATSRKQDCWMRQTQRGQVHDMNHSRMNELIPHIPHHSTIELSIDDANLCPLCIQISTQRYKKGTTKHSSLGMVISQCSVARIGSPDLNPFDLALLFMRKVVKSYPPKNVQPI